jgi:DNA helicase-2/ATP-dependent DNA helicase PcrA
VGDPDQTIYTWRGSHQKLFLDFPARHEGTRSYALPVNYRSTPQILGAAQALIGHNADREENPLTAAVPDGRRPVYFNGRHESEAAAWVLSETLRLRDGGVPLGSIAVLCRSGFMTRPVEEAFFRGKVPARVLAGTPFYRRREVKDAVCYLRMLAYADDMSFLRTVNSPSRKLGRKTLSAAAEEAERRGTGLWEAFRRMARRDPGLWRRAGPTCVEPLEDMRSRPLASARIDDLLEEVLDRTGFEDGLRRLGDDQRLDNLAELKRGVSEFAEDPEAGLADFLDRAALYTGRDAEGGEDSVSVMTVHSAKGLEFDAVFVVGLNEGLFPRRRCETPEEMEEERRLLYVAMTRARRELRLSGSNSDGRRAPLRRPSRFLFEMAGEPDGARPRDLELLTNAPAFAEGDGIVHPSFGRGWLLSVNLRVGSYRIGFEALSTDRDIMFGANLKKV